MVTQLSKSLPVCGLQADRSAEPEELLAMLLSKSLRESGLSELAGTVVEVASQKRAGGVRGNPLVTRVRQDGRCGGQETSKDGLEFHFFFFVCVLLGRFPGLRTSKKGRVEEERDREG